MAATWLTGLCGAVGLWFGIPVRGSERYYPLQASLAMLVTDEARFAPFGRELRAEVENALGAPGASAEQIKLWLGLRVHLAIRARDASMALETADRLRALQPIPEEKAFTGLITRALIAAWSHDGGSNPSEFKVAYAQLLAELPTTRAQREVLQRQRARMAAITEQSLHAQTVSLDSKLNGAKLISLADADALVRLHHQWFDLLPIRTEALDALDEALRVGE